MAGWTKKEQKEFAVETMRSLAKNTRLHADGKLAVTLAIDFADEKDRAKRKIVDESVEAGKLGSLILAMSILGNKSDSFIVARDHEPNDDGKYRVVGKVDDLEMAARIAAILRENNINFVGSGLSSSRARPKPRPEE